MKRNILTAILIILISSFTFAQMGGGNGMDSIVTITGKAIVEGEMMMNEHYYLDENNDSFKDYQLGFGPPWYEPTSGAKRPKNGETVKIEGELMKMMSLPMIMVYKINGLEWKKPHQGKWVHKNDIDSTHVHCDYDSMSYAIFPPGSIGGMMSPDSMYCEFESMGMSGMMNFMNMHGMACDSDSVMMGYSFKFTDPMGRNMMQSKDMMNFSKKVKLNLHYDEAKVNENNIVLKYWDKNSSSWKDLSGFTVDKNKNIVTFSAQDIGEIYTLTNSPAAPTSIITNKNLPGNFSISQNYPNPFNPVTAIKYEIRNFEKVTLKVYNITGQEVMVLVNQYQKPGVYEVKFNSANLSSGVYFYKINVSNNSQVKKMLVIK